MAEGHLIDAGQTLTTCGKRQRGGEIFAALIRRAAQAGVQIVHRFLGLQVQRMVGVGRVLKAGRSVGLRLLLKCSQRLGPGHTIHGEMVIVLKGFRRGLGGGAELAVGLQPAAARVGIAQSKTRVRFEWHLLKLFWTAI